MNKIFRAGKAAPLAPKVRRPNLPANASFAFQLSAQRACFDIPDRWMWYYSHYIRESRRIQDHSGEKVGVWLQYLSEIITDEAMEKFAFPAELGALTAHRQEFSGHNFRNFYNWQQKTLQHIESDPKSLANPYLTCLRHLATHLKPDHPVLFLRKALSHCYSHAIPTNRALEELAEFAPKVLECGNTISGYWGHMLAQVGCDVKSLTVGRPYMGDVWQWSPPNPITDIRSGDYLSQHREDDRALLFVCPFEVGIPHPPNQLARPEFEHWNGDTIILVAQTSPNPKYEASGNQQFVSVPEKAPYFDFSNSKAPGSDDWKLVKSIDIPQWPGFTEKICVFKR